MAGGKTVDEEESANSLLHVVNIYLLCVCLFIYVLS